MNESSVVKVLAIALLLYFPILSEQCPGVQTVWALSSPHSLKHHKTASQHAQTTGSINNSRKRRATGHRLALSSTHRHHRQLSRQSQSEVAHKKHRHITAKTRYAYPMSLFLYEPPPFDLSPLSEEQCLKIRKAFAQGTAEEYPTRSLVKAHLVTYYPIRGGIFFRRQPIKNIIMHSTEPGIPVSAKTVIDGWSHGGRRHPGAHYVVDRDGTIYQALDPDLAAVHINIFKTLPGFDNDNSVGIEMCHQGSQNYPPDQVQAVVKLVVYLQNHYHVPNSNIVTHRYAQQGDHTDPVNFAWNDFIADKTSLQNQSLNYRLADLKAEALAWQPIEEMGPGQSKIYKGNKAVVVDLSKPAAVQAPPNKVTAREKATGPITESATGLATGLVTGPATGYTSAPILSSAAVNLVPLTTDSVSRLVPAMPANVPVSSVNRLVPASFVINNGVGGGTAASAIPIINGTPLIKNGDASNGNVDQYRPVDEAVIPPISGGNQSKKILPLRGPIEMDPNQAASLLNENPASQEDSIGK